jgi:hypothetical protein
LKKMTTPLSSTNNRRTKPSLMPKSLARFTKGADAVRARAHHRDDEREARRANVSLLVNNARVGGQIAAALAGPLLLLETAG